MAGSADGTSLLAAVYGGRLYRSTDSGTTWTETRPAGNTDQNWLSVAGSADGTQLMAGVSYGRLYRSTDSGTTWTETRPAGDTNQNWQSIATDALGIRFLVDVSGGRLYQLTIDASTPVTQTPTRFTTQSFTWGASVDTLSGLAGYLWRVTTILGAAVTSGTANTPSVVTHLTEGNYDFFVKAVDHAGNQGSESQGSVTVDTTAPSIPGTPATTSPATSSEPTWTWSASTDSGSGLAPTPYTVQWSMDSSFASNVNTATSATATYVHTTPLADGEYYFRVKATDAVGNASAYSSNGTRTVTGSPTLLTLSPLNAATNVSPATTLSLTFDRDVTAVSGHNLFIMKASDHSILMTIPANSGSIVTNGSQVTITLESPLPENTALSLTIDSGAFTGTLGAAYGGISDNGTWTFTTGILPLAVTILNPSNDAKGVAPTTALSVTFNQSVIPVSGKNVYIRNQSDGSVFDTVSATSGRVIISNRIAGASTPFDRFRDSFIPTANAAEGAIVTVLPTGALPQDTGLYVTIDPGAFTSLANGTSFTGIADNASWSFITGSVSGTDISNLTYTLVRTDRMTADTPTGGMVCASTRTNATETNLKVTFPSSFTVSTTASNWTTSTTDLLPGATAWPGITTATDVTGNTVTFPISDLTPDTLYCFDFANANTLTTGTVGNNQVGSLTTGDATGTVNFSQYTLSILTNDQIGIIGVVPPTFSFDLDATTDSFTSALSPDTVTSTSGRTATIGTNANNGWVAFVKSANTALTSASTGATIPTTGTVNDTPTDLSTATGYVLNTAVATDANQGIGGVSQGAGYGQEYAGNGTSGGTLSNIFQPIASGSGVTGGDVLTLKEVARISALQAAATDYTDTLTVVAAGRF